MLFKAYISYCFGTHSKYDGDCLQLIAKYYGGPQWSKYCQNDTGVYQSSATLIPKRIGSHWVDLIKLRITNMDQQVVKIGLGSRQLGVHYWPHENGLVTIWIHHRDRRAYIIKQSLPWNPYTFRLNPDEIVSPVISIHTETDEYPVEDLVTLVFHEVYPTNERFLAYMVKNHIWLNKLKRCPEIA